MYELFPAGITPRNTFRGWKVVNTQTGEEIASFPFKLEAIQGEAGLAAYAMIDRLEGNPPDQYIARAFADTNAIV